MGEGQRSLGGDPCARFQPRKSWRSIESALAASKGNTTGAKPICDRGRYRLHSIHSSPTMRQHPAAGVLSSVLADLAALVESIASENHQPLVARVFSPPSIGVGQVATTALTAGLRRELDASAFGSTPKLNVDNALADFPTARDKSHDR
jgi:hypothetical protein